MGKINFEDLVGRLFFVLALCTFSTDIFAQEGFGTANANKDAVVDLNSSNKGLLLPRVSLSALNSPSPLAAHEPGMVIFNTVTAGTTPYQVSPGIYFNDGSRWVRFYDDAALPWNNVLTKTPANSVNQDVYQLGHIGIGVGQSSDLINNLLVQASTNVDPIRTQGLTKSPDSNEEKVMMIDPLTGEVKWADFSAIKTGVYQSQTSQAISGLAFDNQSGVSSFKQPLTFSASEVLLTPTFMTGGTDGTFTMTDGGLFDIFCSVNLSVPPFNSFGTRVANSIRVMAINFNVERLEGGVWTPIANTRTNMDVRSGEPNSSGVMSLTPLSVALRLNKNDQIRFVVQRANSYYLDSGTIQFLADASKGVPFSKTLRVIRLQ